MRITKAKFDGAKVRIEYEQERPDKTYDEFSLHSADQPTHGFRSALNALAEDVIAICELPPTDVLKIKVRGVSVSYTDDILGLCITALKSVKAAQSPLVLNTPHIPEEPYGEGNDAPVLGTETLDRLHMFLLEAEGYVNGEREQPSLLDQPASMDAVDPVGGLGTEGPRA